jgi:Fanconi anemia group D2 protein
VRCGGRFVDAFLRALPLLRARYGADAPGVQAAIQAVQDGNKQLQALCADGKSRRALPLAGRVPAVKKSLEAFLYAMKAFYADVLGGGAGAGGGGGERRFWIGNLKHRSLGGEVRPSQAYGSGGPDGDEEEATQEEATQEEEEEYGGDQGCSDGGEE